MTLHRNGPADGYSFNLLLVNHLYSSVFKGQAVQAPPVSILRENSATPLAHNARESRCDRLSPEVHPWLQVNPNCRTHVHVRDNVTRSDAVARHWR